MLIRSGAGPASRRASRSIPATSPRSRPRVFGILADDHPIERPARDPPEGPDVLVASVAGDGDHRQRALRLRAADEVGQRDHPRRIVAVVDQHPALPDDRSC